MNPRCPPIAAASTRAVALALALGAATVSEAASAAVSAPARTHAAFVDQVKERAAAVGLDLPGFVDLLDSTVAGLIDTNPGLGPDYPIWVIPSRAYAESYVRDSFWTLSGYNTGPFLSDFVQIFSTNAQGPGWQPPLDGRIPTLVRKHDPRPTDLHPFDESTMFWILGARLAGRDVGSEPYLRDAHRWLARLVTPEGLKMPSHGWIDAWETFGPATVSANNAGLYAVTLRALRDMGVEVSADEIAAADKAYNGLYFNGYMHAYRGSDTVDVSSLLGEALALYLWDEPILSDEAVTSTVAHFAPVSYRDGDFLGFKCLSHPDGGYLDPNEFWDAAERDPGNYQNGGSWLLYETLALYAAARHDPQGGLPYAETFARRLKSEIKYERSSKEFLCTGGTCGRCDESYCYCPDGVCGVGSFNRGRSGYGWNAFIKRLVSPRDATNNSVKGVL